MDKTCRNCFNSYENGDGTITCLNGNMMKIVEDNQANDCDFWDPKSDEKEISDAVNAPSHYIGKIECIDYLRDKLTREEFIGFCMGNVLKYASRWRKKDGVQDLKKASVYLNWAIEANEK